MNIFFRYRDIAFNVVYSQVFLIAGFYFAERLVLLPVTIHISILISLQDIRKLPVGLPARSFNCFPVVIPVQPERG
jgi:hypothetical protein